MLGYRKMSFRVLFLFFVFLFLFSFSLVLFGRIVCVLMFSPAVDLSCWNRRNFNTVRCECEVSLVDMHNWA
jgi:hypothetical protein